MAMLFLLGSIAASTRFWGWLHPQAPTTVSNSDTLRNVGLLIGGLLAFMFAGVACLGGTTASQCCSTPD